MSCRIKKTVSFSAQLVTVNYTYSDVEYDRSNPLSFFFSSRRTASSSKASPPAAAPSCPSPPRKQIRLNDKATVNLRRPAIAPLDLSGIPNACRRIPVTLEHIPPMKLNKEKTFSGAANRRPKLSIDTTGAGAGPRFFTNLSTHYKCRSDDESGNEPSSAYLSRISPIC
ncbi:hypothetical protein BX666DRAFT_1887979 [Dichotomocladium elegans]|nr:hypothetical protein BX666DRAFT_1887979 [Dichotomocladium elegans]